MESWLDRMYRRHGRRYLLAILGTAAGSILIFEIPIAALIGAQFLGLSFAEALKTIAFMDAITVVCGMVGVYILRKHLRALFAWSGGERSPELRTDAEAAAFGLPRLVASTVFVFTLLTTPAAAALLVGDYSGYDEALDLISLGFFVVVINLFGGIVGYFTVDLGLRPIRKTFERRTQAATSAVGLAARLLLLLAFLAFLVAISAGGLLLERGEGSSSTLLEIFGVALAITGVYTALLALLLSPTLLGPIRDLIAGTRAVGSGDLGVTVPITTDDELAEMTGAFNEMVDGLRTSEDELRESRSRIVAASDEARRQVERDLHDGAQQHLVVLKLKLEMADRALKSDPASAAPLIEEARGDLAAALAELRDLAHGIYPTVLTSDGLTAALTEIATGAAIPTTVESNGSGRYSAEVEAAVYFCCLEALQNAGKHAGEGAAATIRLSGADAELRFEVADDGAGFEPSANGGSAGLQNMADRIGALGGRLEVNSAPGEGTTVSGSIPT